MDDVMYDHCEICGVAETQLLKTETMKLKGWLHIPLNEPESGDLLSIPVYLCSGCDEQYTLHLNAATVLDDDGGAASFEKGESS